MPLTLSIHSGVELVQVDAMLEENDNNDDNQYNVENPSLDLETYAMSTTGLSRLYRLIYVSDVCPSLRVEALKLALKYVMETYNVSMYQLLHRKLNEVVKQSNGNSRSAASDLITSSSGSIANLCVNDANSNNNGCVASTSSGVISNMDGDLPDIANQPLDDAEFSEIQNMDLPIFDTNWVESTSKKSAIILEKLDNDLKNFKINSIKDSIRRGLDDLGDHYMLCGDLSNALKCYSRTRDYCTTGSHVMNMCWNVIKVSIYLQNWSHVVSYVSKAENIPDSTGTNKKTLQCITTGMKCVSGLADMQLRKYKSAAKNFLATNLYHLDFPDILSPSNVAVYGGLCALATFDRTELQKHVISSNSFKLFLELEPQIRDIIIKFYESKYASCLTQLEEIRDNLYLDMYIAPHVTDLYTKIRNRLLVQYFSPYVSADMRKMAAAFNRTVEALENEIMQLILDGQIKGRIDSHNKILYAKETDQRRVTYQHVLMMGRDYQRRHRLLLLRAAMLRRRIYVKKRNDNTHHPYSIATTVKIRD